MKMSQQEQLTSYLVAFIHGLQRANITDIVISPGSRSTPLALLFVENKQMDCYINIDERSAAFFALGLAKSSKKPVVLLCTSGTAAANYYPAIVEARLSRVPLIVLTADRPHELRDVGAPQTIDQIHLFAHHVKWFQEMAIPENRSQLIRYATTSGMRAVTESMKGAPGPVHLNFPFREPLLPDLTAVKFDDGKSIDATNIGTLQLSAEQYEVYAKKWQQITRGLIVCGQIDQKDFPQAVISLSEALGFPILADPLSQLRSGHSTQTVIENYDAILKTEGIADAFGPELIIRIGGAPVSKPLALYLDKYSHIEQVIVDSGMGWRDPHHSVSEMIYCDETVFCKNIAAFMDEKVMESSWLKQWQQMNTIAHDVVQQHMETTSFYEGAAVYSFLQAIPDGSTVFVGNSMPIRDIDTFMQQTDKQIKIMCNRGANGIDGVISTAIGAAIHSKPLYLLIGDLSFYHDLNGLLVAKMHELNINIIVLNNNGGGIFSYLPQSKEKQHFETLYGTPTGLDFSHVIRMYEGTFARTHDLPTFTKELGQMEKRNGIQVIEVPTEREINTKNHRQLWQDIAKEITQQMANDSI